MINNKGRHERKPTGLRTLVWSAFVVGSIGLAGCGGGGGGGGSGSASAVRVTAVQPPTGPFIGGTPITIHGVNFRLGEVNEVKIGGNAATEIVVVDVGTLTCKAPAGTPGATVDVVVTNALGQGALASAYTYLTPPPPTSDVNGDGIADLIVAAPSDDSVGADGGAVYVFFGSDVASSFQNKTAAQADVKLVGHHAGDAFGACVCSHDVNGDHIDDIVVGAPQLDGVGAQDAGGVYVFYGPFANAAQPLSALGANVKLTGETSVAGDRFGSMIEVADVNGDGKADIMVAAPQHDVANSVDAGCVYAFKGGPSLVSKSASAADFHFDGTNANDRLGARVTCGDLNGDGIADYVVAAPLADPMLAQLQQNAGKVFVVFGTAVPTNVAVTQADAVFYGTAVEDRFGSSAAVADVNGDGTADLIVGAPLTDAYDIDAGRVYVFLGGPNFAGRAADQADVILSGLPTHNSFGRTIRTGDANGDGIVDMLIGAPDADYLNDRNGRAYLFLGSTTLQDHVAVDAASIFNGEAAEGDALGSAVSLLDMNGDGFADVCCASAQHAGGAGRAYLWMSGNGVLNGAHLAANADVLFTGLEAGSQFGGSVAEGQ